MLAVIAALLMQTAGTPTPDPAPTPPAPQAKPKKICRLQSVTGSNMETRICLTVAEWKVYFHQREIDEGGLNQPRTSGGQVSSN